MTVRNPIDAAELNFECKIGEPRAFFEFVEGEKTIRAVYCTYAGRGPNPDKLNDWIIDNVFKPLLEMGGHYLYWRLPEKIEFRHPNEYDSFYRIYTRIAVFDKDFIPLTIPNMVKPEGEPTRKIQDDREAEHVRD
jgi:hypothetical protein